MSVLWWGGSNKSLLSKFSVELQRLLTAVVICYLFVDVILFVSSQRSWVTRHNYYLALLLATGYEAYGDAVDLGDPLVHCTGCLVALTKRTDYNEVRLL